MCAVDPDPAAREKLWPERHCRLPPWVEASWVLSWPDRLGD